MGVRPREIAHSWAAIPQSVQFLGHWCTRAPNMHNYFRRSKLELRGPRNDSKLIPEAPEGCFVH
eukprot:12075761-Alexandrium_andersonii.AAC.1